MKATKKVLAVVAAVLLAGGPAFAQTRIELGGTGSSLTSVADSLIVGNNAGTALVKEDPTGTCDGTTALSLNDGGADGARLSCISVGGTTAWSSIGDAASNADIGFPSDTTLVQTMTWESAATGVAYAGLSMIANHDSTSDAAAQTLLTVKRAATAGTQTYETLLSIENLDTDGPVTSGISITSAAGVITTAIDASDPEIATGLALGVNDVTVNAVTISAAEFGALDGGILAGEVGAGTLGGAVDIDIDLATTAGSSLKLNATAPSTTEGVITWDATNDRIQVGDGTGTKTFYKQVVGELPGGLGASDCTGTIVNTPVGATNAKQIQAWMDGYLLKQVDPGVTNCCTACATCAVNEFSVSGTAFCTGLNPTATHNIQVAYLY